MRKAFGVVVTVTFMALAAICGYLAMIVFTMPHKDATLFIIFVALVLSFVFCLSCACDVLEHDVFRPRPKQPSYFWPL